MNPGPSRGFSRRINPDPDAPPARSRSPEATLHGLPSNRTSPQAHADAFIPGTPLIGSRFASDAGPPDEANRTLRDASQSRLN